MDHIENLEDGLSVRVKLNEMIDDYEYDNADPVEESIGGISAGSTFFDGGKTFRQMVDELFYPLVYPTYVAPSNNFTENADPYYEIADSINIDFTATFNRGEIRIRGVKTQDRSGLPNTYNYTGTGLPATEADTSLSNAQNLVGYDVVQGTQTWQSSVSYDEGPQPLDSKGNNYGTPLAANTTGYDSVSLEGVYPLFGTTLNITTATKRDLVSMIIGNYITFSMVAETGGNKQFFEIPDAWLGARALDNVQTYNTISGQWETTGLAEWTESATTETIQGNVINYTRFTFNGVDRGEIQIRLVF